MEERKQYLISILKSMRMDFSSKWKLFLEKHLAIKICYNIIDCCDCTDEEEIFFENIIDDIRGFSIFDDGRYMRNIYEKLENSKLQQYELDFSKISDIYYFI